MSKLNAIKQMSNTKKIKKIIRVLQNVLKRFLITFEKIVSKKPFWFSI